MTGAMLWQENNQAMLSFWCFAFISGSILLFTASGITLVHIKNVLSKVVWSSIAKKSCNLTNSSHSHHLWSVCNKHGIVITKNIWWWSKPILGRPNAEKLFYYKYILALSSMAISNMATNNLALVIVFISYWDSELKMDKL